jgi:hypothetical protein
MHARAAWNLSTRGNGAWILATTPQIVSGIDADSLAAVEGFYPGIEDRTAKADASDDHDQLPCRSWQSDTALAPRCANPGPC